MQTDEIETMSLDDHARAFMVYVAGILSDFDRYLATTPRPGRDGAAYSARAMWLTDAEYDDLLRDINRVFAPRLANGATNERRRRLTYHVMLPAPEAAPIGN